jgi:hypothetical protein
MLEKDDSGWRGRQHADSHALSLAKQMILHPVCDLFGPCHHMRKLIALSIGRICRPLPPYRGSAPVRMDWMACPTPRHGALVVTQSVFSVRVYFADFHFTGQ